MFLDELKYVKAFIFDVDGVLTDGLVHVTETGEQLRQFSIRDGYALQLAVKKGYLVAAITGGRSAGIGLRLKGLGITEVFTGVDSKPEVYKSFLERKRLDGREVIYMGDDIPDLAAMKLAGLPVCPADAAEEIKSIAKYISPKAGGRGCVRDVIEKVMRVQGKWHDEDPSAHDGSID